MTTLQHRLDHAVNIQQNLQERLKLLTELHMLVPPRLTAAEQVARDVQLPALEDQASQLKMEVCVFIHIYARVCVCMHVCVLMCVC